MNSTRGPAKSAPARQQRLRGDIATKQIGETGGAARLFEGWESA
jgi:hypothetical protein